MASWFRCCWISLWMVYVLVRNVLPELVSPSNYTVHHTEVSFDQAIEACSPGALTSLATQHEVEKVLRLVSTSVSPLSQNEFTFWVGLRKVKDECVVPTLPLRGFKWMEDGGEESQVSRWTQEPEHTCTTVRCAAIRGQLNGSMVTRWGLIPVSCKNSYQFICKLRDSMARGTFNPEKLATSESEPAAPETKPTVAEPRPVTPEPEPAAPEIKPTVPEPKPATVEPHKPELTLETQKPGPNAPEPDLPAREPDPELKPKTGPEQQEPDPGSVTMLGPDLCQRPHISTARSIILDPDNSSRIQVECWSVRLELRCSGQPTVWRLLDDSPANFTTICDMCEEGFQKDFSGNCVDIDECYGGGSSCRHICLNTEGSYRCVCSDENGKHHDEDSPVCMDTVFTILIPVLVAVALLVVLVAVTVKCCLMRRSKKRAMKKVEKMAMRSKDDNL